MKSESLTDSQRYALKPFTNAFSQMRQELRNLSDEELQSALNAANAASETNCWFVIYEAAQWLKPVITSQLKQRMIDRKAARCKR